ncbi:MAG: phospholipase D-like domain-containing protein [Candidatus Thermoplasmatota archaeon]
MRWTLVALVLALLLPGPCLSGGRSGAPAPAPLDLFGGAEGPTDTTAPALVGEAYYHALRADEYVVVANPGAAPLNVTGWTITDGEGTLTFPASSAIAANARIVVAQNATAYWEDTLRSADFRYGAGNATPMLVAGSFRLNNDGDEVILRDASGATVDVLAYGTSPFGGEGWTGPAAEAVGLGHVARRDFDGGWRDTNTSADWNLVRVWSLGQSEFSPAAFEFTGVARAFVTPDAGPGPLLDLLGNATTSVDLSLYTLTHDGLGEGLARAAARGVRVRVLLEGAPVGGLDREEWAIAGRLASVAEVRFLVDNTILDVQERYRFAHAKYAVIDGSTALVASENWGDSAFPKEPVTGSRGWGLAVDHAPLAAYFTRVFEEDFDLRRRDVSAFAEMAVTPVDRPPEPVAPRTPTFAATTISGAFRVVPVLGPDTTLAEDTILGALRAATTTIHAEVFYADPRWDVFPNLYLEELLAAARRGVAVRLLLDASEFNAKDNGETVAYLGGIAEAEGLDLETKLVDLGRHDLTRLHNKGFVVDGRTVLVSSINWNRDSPTANREAGLLVENPDVAAFFEAAFAWDWRDDWTPPRADAGPDRSVLVGQTATFSGLGSTDDTGVVNWSWDLDGDGRDDAWGPEASTVYRQSGTYAARLRVADVWGNAAEDAAVVIVRPVSPPATSHAWVTPIAALVVAALLISAFRRLRRQRLSKPP